MSKHAKQERRPAVLAVFSVLVGLEVLTGGAALGEVVSPTVVGLAVLVLASVRAGLTFFVNGTINPVGATLKRR